MDLLLFKTLLVCRSLLLILTMLLTDFLVNTSWWFGLVACQLCGHFLNDRVPLRIAQRTGIWHPEYRLWNILIVPAASPIGLGLFGAGLQYHLHYMVLALGTFLVRFGGTYSTPITVIYVTECFPGYPLEVSVVMAIYWQVFGLSLPFFIIPWRAKVGSGWLVLKPFPQKLRIKQLNVK